MKTTQITTLDELVHSDDYEVYQSETLLNPQFHIINNTEVDVDMMLKYNAEGMYGVTHSDFIECWREFLSTLDLDDDIEDSITKEIDACEKWHEDNNSLYTLI